MLLLTTFETKAIATLASNNVLSVILRDPLGSEITLLAIRAPLHILVIISEGLAVPSQVSVQNLAVYFTLCVKKLLIHGVWYNDIAAKLLATSIQTLF